MLPAYSLARTTSGLLAINAWNNDSLPGSAIPFVVADWTYSTGVTAALGANKQLALTNSNATLWYAAQRTSIASRSKTFFFATIMESGAGSGAIFGSAAHLSQVSTPTGVGGGISCNRAGGDLSRLIALAAGTPTTITNVSVATKISGNPYSTNFFVDATVLVERDLSGAATATGSSTPTSGGVGLVFQHVNTAEFHRWIAMSDRFITVGGLPSGATVDIQTPSATTLVVGGDESSGTATIDLMLVNVANAQSLRVLDHLGTVLATFRDVSGGPSNNLIAGGDAFTLSAFPVGAQTLALQAVKLAATF